MLDEEIAKALSLEEKALDEFKRRKNSLPQSQPSSSRNCDGKSNSFVKLNSTSIKICEIFRI